MEVWKPIPSAPRYEASSLGRLRGPRGIFTGSISMHGYYRTNIRQDGRNREYKVHRLVAEAFHGLDPDKPQVNHIDGDKANNRPDNLEWCTLQDNLRHNWEVLGRTSHEGVDDGFLNPDQVRAIRILVAAGMSYRQVSQAISRKFSTVAAVASGKTWRHIT